MRPTMRQVIFTDFFQAPQIRFEAHAGCFLALVSPLAKAALIHRFLHDVPLSDLETSTVSCINTSMLTAILALKHQRLDELLEVHFHLHGRLWCSGLNALLRSTSDLHQPTATREASACLLQ